MNKHLRIICIKIAAAGLLGWAVAMPAAASDSIVIPVTATVTGVCKFFTSPIPTLTIANSGANIDPSLTGNATGNATLNYKCTTGQTPTFALTGGASLTLTCSTAGTCGATTMIATMSLGAAPGVGTGFAAAAQAVTLTGTIADTIYGPASAGTYQGNQTVTVNP